MEVEQYRAAEEWLSSFVEYSTAIEIEAEALEDMAATGICLSDIRYVLMNGNMEWADRDYEGCLFVVRGRNCDEEEITVQGRFESAAELVVIKSVSRPRAEK